MEETIKTSIICPSCSASLDVRIKVGTDKNRVNIVCPVCKTKNLLAAFTEKRSNGDDTTLSGDTDITDLGDIVNGVNGKATGCLRTRSGDTYRLKRGINVVGRKAETSDATVQIATGNRRMSRRHAIIEVTGDGIHYLENVRDKKNSTSVNGRNVEDGDRFILRNDDRICMAGDELTFIMD